MMMNHRPRWQTPLVPLLLLPLLLLLLLLRAAPVRAAAAADGNGSAPLSAGEGTIFDDTRNAFGLPLPQLNPEHRAGFFVGNSYFNQNWIAAPSSVGSRDGLGPLFNARSCSGCHFKDGRSRPPDPGGPMTTMLLRISVPGSGTHGGPRPDPTYGDQIQGSALPQLRKEADVLVEFEAMGGQFKDGEGYLLRKPRYRITGLGYGPLARGVMVSPRVAPAMVGLGLLEAVPEATLTALEDPRDRNGDGISGRLNRVWDVTKKTTVPGRFGWKAEQPTVLQQSAAAFVGDMGLTSPLFPTDRHSIRQSACDRIPGGDHHPEVSDAILRDVVLYARSLGVPARRRVNDPVVMRGEQLFSQAGCPSCHVTSLLTGDYPELPELSHQLIRPYTDLLLHDMGAGLADGRPTYGASGSEWRTPPLWGIGLVAKVNDHSFFMHDGRARGVAEAILWHGGEARAARDAFTAMPRADRRALTTFLESL